MRGEQEPANRAPRGGAGRGCALGCAGILLLFVGALGVLLLCWCRVPSQYPPTRLPIPPPNAEKRLGGDLDGFDSPYLGHTGSWDGRGGGMWGSSKIPDLDAERAMGLRWTFMPVYWRQLEPDHPIDLARETPTAWRALDAFVVSAHERKLNVLMQAPVVGGNAGGPPAWAGRREPGKSAPADMAALAAFAGKLAERYRPGGTLAQQHGWGTNYGVRAWELDNEPESYRTHWQGQAADYAEFVTLAAARIRAADAQAVLVAPGLAAGKSGLVWLEAALKASARAGSPVFRAQALSYSLGPVVDVVSFHNYEGLDSAFAGEPRTIAQVFDDLRTVFEKWERQSGGFGYARKLEYWHTEGNYDFLGLLSRDRRAAWRIQFFTRAFAAGVRKVVVMDASTPEQRAVGAYVRVLPNPFPMLPATNEVGVLRGRVAAFHHPDAAAPDAGQVWVLWAHANTGDATVDLPTHHDRVEVISVSGDSRWAPANASRVRLELTGDSKMAAPLLVVDRLQRH